MRVRRAHRDRRAAVGGPLIHAWGNQPPVLVVEVPQDAVAADPRERDLVAAPAGGRRGLPSLFHENSCR